MSKKSIWIVVAITGLIALGGFVAKKMGWVGQEEKTEVEIASVKKSDITEKVSASGKVKPELEIKISADVSGEIIQLTVKEGDSVSKGDLLLKIRPDNYQSLVDRAKAALNTSKANLAQMNSGLAQSQARFIRVKLDHERNRKLFEQKVISEADWETSKANFSVAENELESAKSSVESARFGIANAEATVKDATENLRKTAIYSPMNGIVSRLNVEVGERVVGTAQMTGTELMRIANLQKMEVEVEVNENDIVRVHIGDSAEIEVDSYSYLKKKFKGIVTSIANSAVETLNAEAVTEFKVEVQLLPASYQDIQNEKSSRTPFRPGMTASLEIATNRRNQVLSVPLSAVVSRSLKKEEGKSKKTKEEMTEAERRRDDLASQKREVVFVFADGKVEMRPVKTGIADFEQIEIIDGVKENETIITGPFSALTKTLENGDNVKLKENKNSDKKGKSISISF
ncbi:MAG TPA: efflux RND transporter periplasmic adaptor subunit [Catalimonadaceae bacterium]|nr:efflux RND transporter periplasmic adaptor subunit [Catalimonadaceae bacterium]